MAVTFVVETMTVSLVLNYVLSFHNKILELHCQNRKEFLIFHLIIFEAVLNHSSRSSWRGSWGKLGLMYYLRN